MTHYLAVAVTLIAAACGANSAAPQLNSSAVAITEVACPERLAGGQVVCGTVAVRLDPRHPDSPTELITIATMPGSDPSFDLPMAVLQGGPGGASTDMAAWLPQQPFTQVFIDQRGTGFAGPDFDCVEFDRALASILAAAAAKAEKLAIEAFNSCARRLANEPLLVATTTHNHAADVAQVMNGLGYDQWLAYGVSYGSTIGLELLRQSPLGLVGVVLDGVYPPTLDVDAAIAASAERSILAVADECVASVICSDYTDDLPGTLDQLIAQLDEIPLVVTLSGHETGTGERIDVVLDGVRLAEFTFQLLYNEAQVRYLPAVLAAIEDGDKSAAQWLVRTATRTMIASFQANNEATYFAVQCHDRLPLVSRLHLVDDVQRNESPSGRVGFAAAVTPIPLAVQCEAWEQDAALPVTDSVVISDVATLLLSGQFDPITPPQYAATAAQTLSASTVVTQSGRGHGIWYGNDCIASIVEAFAADPTGALDTKCANQGVPVEWAEPRLS